MNHDGTYTVRNLLPICIARVAENIKYLSTSKYVAATGIINVDVMHRAETVAQLPVELREQLLQLAGAHSNLDSAAFLALIDARAVS